jgi:hypothetical protein
MKKDVFCTTFGSKMFVMELNGRKNVTEAIVKKFVKTWLEKVKCIPEFYEQVCESKPTMEYIQNSIQKGTIEEKHTVFSPEVQKEFGKESEDWYYVSTQNSGGGYSENEIVWVKED